MNWDNSQTSSPEDQVWDLTLSVVSGQGAQLGSEATMIFDEQGGTVGRAQGNTWVLPDPKKYLSGRHATVFVQDGCWYATDTSTNGLYHNDPENRIGHGNQVQLQDGDQLFLGEYQLEVRIALGAPSGHELHTDQPLVITSPTDHGFPGGSLDPLDLLDDHAPAPGFAANPGVSDPGAVLPTDLDPRLPLGDDGLSGLDQNGFFADVNPAEAGHSTPMQEFYTPPSVQPGASGNELIPDDWDMTGSTPAVSSDHLHTLDANPFPTDNTPKVTPPPPVSVPEPQPKATPAPTPGHGTPAAAVSSVDNQAAIAKILATAGLGDVRLSPDEEEAFLQNLGSILNTVTSGLLDVLGARAQLKSEFRLAVTTIKHVENNPLKFSANTTDALKRLLKPEETGYLSPLAAVQEAFDDIKSHQIAMLAGMRAAFDFTVCKFDPRRIRAECESQLKNKSFNLQGKKGKYWEYYEDYYVDQCGDLEDSFQKLFGDEFVKAYEKQIHDLLLAKRNSPQGTD